MPLSKIKTSSITADAASVNLNIDSNTLFLDVANNRVGVRTTSPSRPFVVSGSSSDASTIQLIDDVSGSGAATGSLLQHQYAEQSLAIRNYGANGFIRFDTNGATERVRITSAGLVGVGTTTPSAEGRLTVGSTTVTDKNGIVINRGAVGSVESTQTGIFNEINGIGASESLTLRAPGGYKFQNNNGSTEWMRIDTLGNITVGTGTTAGKLTVAGKIRALGGDIELDTGMIATNSDANPIRMGVNGAESFRIQNGGFVHVGQVSSNATRGLVNIVTPAGTACGFSFADSQSGSRGRLWWGGGADGVSLFNDDNSPLRFGTTGVARMAIDFAGRITTPFQPAFRAWNPSTVANAANTFVFSKYSGFQAVGYNNGSHFNASTGRFVAPVAGMYFFGWGGLVSQNGGAIRMQFAVNGGSTTIGTYSNTEQWQSNTAIIYLNANDYVEFGLVTGAGNVNHTEVTGFLMG